MEAKIFEQGNGFPDVGAIVEIDGSLYRVAETNGRIHTSRAGNYIYATLSPAGDDDGPVFPVRIVPEPRAVETDGTWAVEDAAGGRWFPGDDAEAEILASEDPAATAVRICRESPMRGTWRS